MRNNFFDAYAGELPPGSKEAFDRHIEGCRECRKKYEELATLLAAMSRYERPDPGAAFWEGYWGRFYPRLAAGKKNRFTLFDVIREAVASLIHRPLGGMRLAALVTASILIGALLSRTFTGGDGPGQSAEQSQLLMRASSFLVRSEVILLGFVNTDAGVRESVMSNIALQKDYSAILVGESDALMKDLAEGSEYQLRLLVEDLRFILMQIANLEEDYRPGEVQLIQDGVRRKALLFKLSIEAMKMSETEKNADKTGKWTNIRNTI